ncbi:hypothetical protein ACQP1U_13260 [Actinomycetota bacterium]
MSDWTPADRVDRLTDQGRPLAARLLELSAKGLRRMYLGPEQGFPQTARGVAGPDGPRFVLEGHSPRYTAMSALGLNNLTLEQQREALGGTTSGDLAWLAVRQAETTTDPGVVALAGWAVAEVTGEAPDGPFHRMAELLRTGDPLPTVDTAWMLTAAVAAADKRDTAEIIDLALPRLLAAQGPQGIFAAALPPESLGRLRAHVGCFADQVYPIQALARLAAAGRTDLLEHSARCADRIVEPQGGQGQWWWHYDSRTGGVVEGFPVYSVHQHAMAPMCLFDLQEAGGPDHSRAVELGLSWLTTHPETVDELIDDRFDVVWRKVGRREGATKAARKLNAVTTSLKAGLRVPGLDRLLPPGPVDHECRPYELGWLLYAWTTPGRVRG